MFDILEPSGKKIGFTKSGIQFYKGPGLIGFRQDEEGYSSEVH
jgi:hypothetical protein